MLFIIVNDILYYNFIDHFDAIKFILILVEEIDKIFIANTTLCLHNVLEFSIKLVSEHMVTLT